MPRVSSARYTPRRGTPVAIRPAAWGEPFDVASQGNAAKGYTEEGDYAVVDIEGPLEQHGETFWADTYDAIRARALAAIASEKRKVCLRINSPGGDFAGAIELARELRDAAAAAGKELVSFTDSAALSAAYALACAGSRITITSSGFVGSIGVWVMLADETARDASFGVRVAVVASGTRKADRNPHVPMTDSALAAAQNQVDEMAALFFAWVVESRGMSLEAVEALQGSEQFGTRAQDLKLADAVVNSWSEFLIVNPNTESKSNTAPAAQKPKSKSKETQMPNKAKAGNAETIAALKMAIKMLEEGDKAAADDSDGDGDGNKEKEAAKAAADEKAAKASDDDKENAKAADEKKDEQAKAAARGVAPSSDSEVALAARIHALETGIANEREATERAKLLATRPDFSKEVRATLENASLEIVKNACAKWPRVATAAEAASAAVTPAATRGKTQVDDNAMGKMANGFGESEDDFVKRNMRGFAASPGVTSEGRTMTLGFMSKDEAIKLAAANSKGGK